MKDWSIGTQRARITASSPDKFFCISTDERHLHHYQFLQAKGCKIAQIQGELRREVRQGTSNLFYTILSSFSTFPDRCLFRGGGGGSHTWDCESHEGCGCGSLPPMRLGSLARVRARAAPLGCLEPCPAPLLDHSLLCCSAPSRLGGLGQGPP